MPAATNASKPGVGGPLKGPRVRAVIDRITTTRRFPGDDGPRQNLGRDPADRAEYGFSVLPEQGDPIYLLCRAMGAQRVMEFATSVGMSTFYFAAAMRDNGGGRVTTSEIVRNPSDGFLSINLPLTRGTELAVKVG